MITFASTLYGRHRALIHAYLSMTGGSAGRLVLSLVYFICVANGLSIAEFGLFATASATGIMISRTLAFGFMSPLYRVATVKPLLVGTYSLGFLVGALLSLPLICALSLAVYYAVFAGDMALWVFAAFMAAEILFWRGLEVVVIVLNGLGRFGRAAMLVVIGTAIRTVAALVFSLPQVAASLATWSLLYLLANAVCLAIAMIVFFPRCGCAGDLNCIFAAGRIRSALRVPRCCSMCSQNLTRLLYWPSVARKSQGSTRSSCGLPILPPCPCVPSICFSCKRSCARRRPSDPGSCASLSKR
ncbi:hypothetical protein P6U16_07045 [Rhizobium sp. 32-5/1]|uniref:lipopolysaccharide biosynthesis protein n=1 Tax=Rhizobium sp. 32-5/1 TaxID=3019602 RepID=UPI00240E4F44|nr:hypothetical protein [Rhizobium sp. 32-5/1]WEZ84381.1 hypothetical protein P6U16_07045 [Rhizobium sp. 32-5/1]